jgi:hypothetical protein
MQAKTSLIVIPPNLMTEKEIDGYLRFEAYRLTVKILDPVLLKHHKPLKASIRELSRASL